MNPLLREHAPITTDAWRSLEHEVKAALELNLAARRVVDVEGPHGWEHGAAPTGRADLLERAALGKVGVRRRRVVPLLELEAPFEIARDELEALGRGARDVDLSEAVKAAERMAHAEDGAVFHGYPEGGIAGMVEEARQHTLLLAEQGADVYASVVEAVEKLRDAGVQGPHGIALGPRCYADLLKASDPGGYPARRRLERILEGPIVRAPALDGALVLSLRGGDFELLLGQDLALGYADHSTEAVRFRLLETFAFRILSPEAVVPLAYESAPA